MTRHHFLITAGVALFPLTATAQDKETLETKMTADRDVILLEWSKKHPWHTELTARGAALVAEYRTQARGVVSEVVASGKSRGSDDRTIRFRLPDRITSPPAGPVCLLVQLPNRKLLPIRRVNKRGDDTARFRYEDWESEAAKRAGAEALRARVAAAERALQVKTKDIEAQEGIVAKNGWQSLEACQAIPTPQLGAVEQPYDVVPLAGQDEIARRVCIRRVWWSDQQPERAMKAAKDKDAGITAYINRALAFVQVPSMIDFLLKELTDRVSEKDPNFVTRQNQARQFRQDWERWAPTVESYSKPHFGSPNETLYL